MTTVPTLRRRLTNAALTLAAVAAAATLAILVSPGGGGRTIAAEGQPLGAGGEFHEIDPVRIYDSRANQTAVGQPQPKGARQTGTSNAVRFDVSLVGDGGFKPFVDADRDGFDDEVLAVVVNVTVAGPSQAGHATIFPKGTSPGESSVVNYLPGRTVANSAILRPGAGGKVTVHLETPGATGTAHFIVDVSGWFSTSDYATRGARVQTIDPARIYDSGATNLRGARKVSLDIRGAKDLDSGRTIVPDSDNVVGAIVNLTGVNEFGGSTATHLSLVPDNFDPNVVAQQPTTSNLNLSPGQTRANVAFVPVGPDGRIHLFSLQGEVRAVVDVTGYLVKGVDETSRAGRVIPLVAPFRAFDTRQSDFFDQPLGPARAEPWSFEAFANDVKIDGNPVGAQAGLIGNFTATGLERQYSWAPVRTHMTAYPYPADAVKNSPDECKPAPDISNVNLGEGEAVPNMALLRYGQNPNVKSQICVFNLAGYVDYLLDVYAVVLSD